MISTRIKIIMLTAAVFILGQSLLGAQEKSSHTKSVDLKGYYLNCSEKVYSLMVKDKGSWRKVLTNIRSWLGKGGYFLDGKYHGYSMCENAKCEPMQSPYTIELVEYQKTGVQKSPYQETEPGYKPAFRTVDLKGEIKVSLDYYLDDKCTQKAHFEQTIEN